MKSSDKLKSRSQKIEIHKHVGVFRNSLPAEEAESIADKWMDQKNSRMSLEETLAHAAQLQKETLAAK